MPKLSYRDALNQAMAEEMRRDEEGLLRFAFLWLRFSLFGESTVKMNPGVAEAFQENLEKESAAEASEKKS